MIVSLLAEQGYPFVDRLFKGTRIVTVDDVASLGIIGKNQNPFALGAADFFAKLANGPRPFSLSLRETPR